MFEAIRWLEVFHIQAEFHPRIGGRTNHGKLLFPTVTDVGFLGRCFEIPEVPHLFKQCLMDGSQVLHFALIKQVERVFQFRTATQLKTSIDQLPQHIHELRFSNSPNRIIQDLTRIIRENRNRRASNVVLTEQLIGTG